MQQSTALPKDDRFIDITGEKFGRYFVVSYEGKDKNTNHLWVCACSCGNIRICRGCDLRGNKTKSCGCYSRDMARERAYKHGYAGTNKGQRVTSEYAIWAAMIRRCKSPKDAHYHRYGGRGISVCEQWKKFPNFIKDMGDRPSKSHSLDRINNDGNYCPENCRWATYREQAANTSTNRFVNFNGKRMILADAKRESGLSRGCIDRRMKLGWSDKDTFEKPQRRK